MIVASAIRQRGFRKWYERELIRSHGNLLLLLFSALGALGGMEAMRGSDSGTQLLMLLSIAVAAAIGVRAMRSYLFHLTRAETVANQAVCPECKTYARWQVESDATFRDGAIRLTVCCRQCGHRWPIDC